MADNPSREWIERISEAENGQSVSAGVRRPFISTPMQIEEIVAELMALDRQAIEDGVAHANYGEEYCAMVFDLHYAHQEITRLRAKVQSLREALVEVDGVFVDTQWSERPNLCDICKPDVDGEATGEGENSHAPDYAICHAIKTLDRVLAETEPKKRTK